MKTYSAETLIETVIEAARTDLPTDYTDYYTRLLSALEVAFEVILSEPLIWTDDAPREAQALWTIFMSAVASYNSIQRPWDMILESGAMLHRLRQWGEDADPVFSTVSHIAGLTRQNQEAHMDLLRYLLSLMYGDIDDIITSEDLREMGFDDSAEPKLKDFI
jgi:hypothetical protein